MKNLRSTIILGVLTLGSLFTACDNFDEDVPPGRMSQVVVHDDTFASLKNQQVNLNVLANDSIGGQATLQFSPPAHGTIQTNSNGTVFYQPDLDFIGTDNFNYKACIGNDCATALVTIQVKNDSINTCTVKANDDFRVATSYRNDTTSYYVLYNDNICGIDTLGTNVTITKGPAHGQAFMTSLNRISYSPIRQYAGSDEITYTINNSKGQSSAKVLINVECNPDAVGDSTSLIRHLGTFMDTVSIKVLKNDLFCQNGGPVTLNVINTHTTYGNVMVIGTGPNARIIYSTQYPGKNVFDGFQYRICQGNGCSTTSVQVHIR